MKRIVLLVFAITFYFPSIINSQTKSDSLEFQNKLNILYLYHIDEEMENWYLFSLPHIDIEYKMENYRSIDDEFSLVGKVGINGMFFHIHFGPEYRFGKYFYINATLGVYVGLYIGIGLIGEMELGVSKQIYKSIYFKSSVALNEFYHGNNYGVLAPILKVGVGFDL